MRLSFGRRTLRFARPLETSYGALGERELIVARIECADGARAQGEAAPLEPYDGVPLARVEAALLAHCEALREVGEPAWEEPRSEIAAVLERCRAAAQEPAALAAVDLALWDLAGRRTGRPVCELLCESPSRAIEVNASIAAADRAGAAAQAAQAARAGFRCIKLKVGLGDDASRVAAVRAAAGPAVALRLDANGAWSVERAVRTIEALEPAGLELVEEPVHGIEALRAVRGRVAARIAIDETADEPGALEAGAADAVCLKISRCGGISGLLDAARLVRASGAEPYVTSTYDGPLGIAAGVHAAAALAAEGPVPACGLATLALFEDAGGLLPARAGAIAVPGSPGLGVETA